MMHKPREVEEQETLYLVAINTHTHTQSLTRSEILRQNAQKQIPRTGKHQIPKTAEKTRGREKRREHREPLCGSRMGCHKQIAADTKERQEIFRMSTKQKNETEKMKSSGVRPVLQSYSRRQTGTTNILNLTQPLVYAARDAVPSWIPIFLCPWTSRVRARVRVWRSQNLDVFLWRGS